VAAPAGILMALFPCADTTAAQMAATKAWAKRMFGKLRLEGTVARGGGGARIQAMYRGRDEVE